MEKDEVRRKYDGFASKYDRTERPLEFLGLRRLRRRLLARASGKVLETAVGTGMNIPFYPPSCEVTAVDVSSGMVERARRKAAKHGLPVDFRLMDAETLEFDGETFDTIVNSMSTCTFADPVKALQEMGRVCKKDGRILLLEHGRSDGRILGRLQDWRADSYAKKLGCVWNREPAEMVRRAGLEVIESRRSFLGIFYSIMARPQ